MTPLHASLASNSLGFIPPGLSAVLAGAIASATAGLEAELTALTGRPMKVAAAGAPGPRSDWREFAPADDSASWWEVTMGFHGGATGQGELALEATVARQLAGRVLGAGREEEGLLDVFEQRGLLELGSVVLGGLLEAFLARLGSATGYGLPRLERREPTRPEAARASGGWHALMVPLRITVEGQALDAWLQVRAPAAQWTAWSGESGERKSAA